MSQIREVYARKGEEVCCVAGCTVGYISRTILRGTIAPGDIIDGYKIKMGELFGDCPHCGEAFNAAYTDSSGGFFHFRNGGWRK